MLSSISAVSFKGQNYGFSKIANVNANKNENHQNVINYKENVIPFYTYQAYNNVNPVSFTGYGKAGKKLTHLLTEYKLPADGTIPFKSIDNLLKKYSYLAKEVMQELQQRANKKGQFLNWIDLPGKMLEKNSKGVSHLDEIAAQAKMLLNRKNPDGSTRPLIVLGIGGSKHTGEFLSSMFGVAKTGKLHFYSDIDSVSYKQFLNEIGNDLTKNNFLVVSKSGTTYETKQGYTLFLHNLTEEYKNKGYAEKEAKALAEKHFAICTDAKGTEKNLRGIIGDKNGTDNNYIKELYVHDDVGGRYSMFDDAGLFEILYAGVSKKEITSMLKAAQNASKRLLYGPLNSNPALKSALFNIGVTNKGDYTLTQNIFYGKPFSVGGENWLKQLYLESIKDFELQASVAPESMHYATEGQFSKKNLHAYNTVMTIMNPKSIEGENYNKYTGALKETYNATTPLTVEQLEVANGDHIDPKSIGEFIQYNHFKTIYLGMLKRAKQGEKINLDKSIPEVLQPAVETYKNKFKPGSPYALNVNEFMEFSNK